MGFVVDASVALAWCFSDEISTYADAVLGALEGEPVLVPAIFSLEVANALIVAQRSKRINLSTSQRFISLLEGLTIQEDLLPTTLNISNVLPLAQEYNLSAYDASYLAVAARHNASLATLDKGLRKAAQKAGVTIMLQNEYK
jgi:predicted nucleic acid-binding protein